MSKIHARRVRGVVGGTTLPYAPPLHTYDITIMVQGVPKNRLQHMRMQSRNRPTVEQIADAAMRCKLRVVDVVDTRMIS